jgi:hypothetical protein
MRLLITKNYGAKNGCQTNQEVTMKYVFVSFADAHTKKNIGCCIVQVENLKEANEKCKELGLMPGTNNFARGYELEDEEAFKAQEMELNRFYSKAEMEAKGFEKD